MTDTKASPGTEPALRVAVVNLTNGGISGGYRKYLRAVLPRLAASSEIASLDVFSPAGVDAMEATAAKAAGVRLHTWQPSEGWRGFATARREVRSCQPDVVFVPTSRWADFGAPTVVMVRNMEPLVRPFRGNIPTEAAKNVLRYRTTRDACRRADRVIAVSRFVADFLETRWHVPRERIGVVYHGLDESTGETLPPLVAPPVDRPFLLTAGSIRPARGLEDLIGALLALPPSRRPTLVVAGDPTPDARRYAKRLRDRCVEAGLGSDILWIGHATTPVLAWLYARCSAFVMTTRVEACPNVALESMAHGALIVAADNAPLPEMFGDTAIHYRAGDPLDLARALETAFALSPDAIRARSARAIERASTFNWNRTVDATIAELRQAMRLSRVPRPPRRASGGLS